jgi:anaerobic ribonucleoside-triphosphate reductase activating protein
MIEQLKGIQLDILHYVDVLVDGPFIQDWKDTTLPFRGSLNQRIIDLRTPHNYANILNLQ